jgi:carbamoyltransferase
MTRSTGRAILGLSYSYDSGAALLVDGRIVAAVNEERMNREKCYAGFPALAVAECLRIAGLSPGDVGRVAVGGLMNFPYESGLANTASARYQLSNTLSRLGLLRLLIGTLPFAYTLRAFFGNRFNPVFNRHGELTTRLAGMGVTAPVAYFDHHLCHNAGAYYASGFDRCHAVSIDAFGDCFSSRIYECTGGVMRLRRTVPAYHSPAHHYAYVTALLGFTPTRHEGKVTGLAAFGDSTETARILGERITYSASRRTPFVRGLYQRPEVDYLRAALADFSREDIAAGVQQVLEDVATRYVRDNIPDIPSTSIVLSGGVAANVRLNQKVRDLGFRDVFVFPHMGDGGLSVGACYAANAGSAGAARNQPIADVYLGSEYTDAEIESALEGSGFDWRRSACVEQEVAGQVAAGKIVARFNGRMEYGPRALCNRSILYKADDPDVNTWLNHRLQRTEFMPFAPVLLREDAPRFLKDYDEARSIAARYMTITYDVTDLCKAQAAAIVHVDGTARPQIIDEAANPSMFGILTEYKRLRGFSVMVNTSFNMHEEPIIRTPDEAIESVKQAGLDVLAIGPFVAFNRAGA